MDGSNPSGNAAPERCYLACNAACSLSGNELMHSGRHPAESSALAAYAATTELLQAALLGREPALCHLDLADHALSDPFGPADPRPLDPKYWMPIPKLPGEEDLEREEAKARESSGRRRRRSRAAMKR